MTGRRGPADRGQRSGVLYRHRAGVRRNLGAGHREGPERRVRQRRLARLDGDLDVAEPGDVAGQFCLDEQLAADRLGSVLEDHGQLGGVAAADLPTRLGHQVGQLRRLLVRRPDVDGVDRDVVLRGRRRPRPPGVIVLLPSSSPSVSSRRCARRCRRSGRPPGQVRRTGRSRRRSLSTRLAIAVRTAARSVVGGTSVRAMSAKVTTPTLTSSRQGAEERGCGRLRCLQPVASHALAVVDGEHGDLFDRVSARQAFRRGGGCSLGHPHLHRVRVQGDAVSEAVGPEHDPQARRRRA